jgi:excisionase family DNA binding protein
VLEQLELVDDWLDAPAAGDYLGCSVGQVRNLVSEGRLPRHGPKGHRLRFRRSELDAYVKGIDGCLTSGYHRHRQRKRPGSARTLRGRTQGGNPYVSRSL